MHMVRESPLQPTDRDQELLGPWLVEFRRSWHALALAEWARERGPGAITIHLDDRLLGSGPTFSEAMQAAQRRAATLATSTEAPLARAAV